MKVLPRSFHCHRGPRMTRSAHVHNGEWHLYTLQIYSKSKLWLIIAPLVTRLSRTFAPRSCAKEKTWLYIFDPTPIHLARNINFVCLVTRRQPRSHLHGPNSSLGTTKLPGETWCRTLKDRMTSLVSAPPNTGRVHKFWQEIGKHLNFYRIHILFL